VVRLFIYYFLQEDLANNSILSSRFLSAPLLLPSC